MRIGDKTLQHQVLLYFERVGAGKLLVRPDAETPDLLMGGQLWIDCRYHRAAIGAVACDQHCMHVLAAVRTRHSDDNRVLHGLKVLQERFYVFRIDVLTVGQYDQVFLAAFEVEESIFVDITQVAGLVPLVLEGSLCNLRLVPVARRNVRPARMNLAI